MGPRIDKLLKLPTKQKLLLLATIVLLEVFLLYWGLYMPKQKELKELQARLADLQSQTQESKKVADNLPKFKKEYEELNARLTSALTELPNQKEIPSLLTNITGVGKDAGLDFLIFRPKSEEEKDFYASVPVDISVSGTYQGIAKFFIAVGNLPRIVNIGNLSFIDVKTSGGKTILKVNCLATTFRFLDKKAAANESNNK